VLRGCLRLAAVVAVVACSPAVLGLCAVLAGRRRARVVRGYHRVLLAAAGVRLRVIGPAYPVRAAGRGFLTVADHVSWLDVPVLCAVYGSRMLAKAEVRGWPVIGPVAAAAGTVFLRRDRLRALPAAVAAMAQALRTGDVVAGFPEGTTWCGIARGRYRPAMFQAAVDAGVPVVPVSLRFTVDDLLCTRVAFVGAHTLPGAIWRTVTQPRLEVRVRAGQAISPAGSTRRDLAGRAQRAARDGLGIVPTATAVHG
jgi:1-acyl-sn-glycerol-3-phosphate acyltransferase